MEGKALLQIDYENRAAVFDSLILCRFFRDFIKWNELIDIVRGSTGLDFSKDELQQFANRITEQTRYYKI